MRKIKEVLRLKLDAKLSHERIAQSLAMSKGVVAKYAGLAASAGLDWPAIREMDEAALERLSQMKASSSNPTLGSMNSTAPIPGKSGPEFTGRHCLITVFPIDATGRPATPASRSANGDAPG